MSDKITNYFDVVKQQSNTNNNNNNENKEDEKNKNNKRVLPASMSRTDTILDNNNNKSNSINTTSTSTTSTTTTKSSNNHNNNNNTIQVKKKSKLDNKNNEDNNNIESTQIISPSTTSSLTLDDFDFTDDEQNQATTIFLIGEKDEKFSDVWTGDHVKMPCSKNNVMKVEDKYRSRWYLIVNIYMNQIKNSEELETAIKEYNPRCNWDFQGLHDFFESEFSEAEALEFFSRTLPAIVHAALALPQLCPRAIPLLGRSVDKEIIFSQRQIASLMANAFLCTFPRQGGQSTSSRYPSVNFHSLYSAPCTPARAAKLKCIIHYFQKVLSSNNINRETHLISFHRQVIGEEECPNWEKSETLLKNFTVVPNGTIEENGIGMLQVDFANKLIGGGVLGHGCVQEEIRFLINPELIISRLFCAQLDVNETIIMTGSEQFSKYSGYGDTFTWAGNFDDTTAQDSLGRRTTSIVAMDAIKIQGDPFKQFSPINVDRELTKSFCGFYDRVSATLPPPVASGNWGCGVFGGDRHLKSIIQYMSASQAGRDLVYHSYGDIQFSDELTTMIAKLRGSAATVSMIYHSLWEYYKLMASTKSDLSLFTYLDAHFG